MTWGYHENWQFLRTRKSWRMRAGTSQLRHYNWGMFIRPTPFGSFIYQTDICIYNETPKGIRKPWAWQHHHNIMRGKWHG